jgi:hypothetical protein
MKRPNDPNPDPPGGRAAKRLEMFEQARAPKEQAKANIPAAARPSRAPRPPQSRKKKR